MKQDIVTLFVFYEPGPLFESWIYEYPKAWKWVGGGHTNPLGRDEPDPYSTSREDQFEGPITFRSKAHELLSKQLEKLKNKNIVRAFKVCYSYELLANHVA